MLVNFPEVDKTARRRNREKTGSLLQYQASAYYLQGIRNAETVQGFVVGGGGDVYDSVSSGNSKKEYMELCIFGGCTQCDPRQITLSNK